MRALNGGPFDGAVPFMPRNKATLIFRMKGFVGYYKNGRWVDCSKRFALTERNATQ